MGLTTTNALVSIGQNLVAPVPQAQGAVLNALPGALLTFALQSTSLIQTWSLLIQDQDDSLLNFTITWNAGQQNALTYQLGPQPRRLAYTSTVSDGSASVATASGSINVSNGPLLGKFTVSPDLTVVEDATGRVFVPAAQTVNVYTMPSPSIANLETVTLPVHLMIKGQSSGSGDLARYVRGTMSGGVFSNHVGGTNPIDTDATFDPVNALSSSLSGFTAQIVQSGSTLVVQCIGATSQGSFVVVDASSPHRFTAPGAVPAPTITSIDVTTGPGAGGIVIHVIGSGFSTAASVTVCGASATFLPAPDDNHLTITTGAYFGLPNVAGDLVIQNASASATLSACFTYTSTLATTPSTILGNLLRAQYENSGIQQSGGLATSWTDVGGLAQNMTAVASPTYNASSGNISPAGPSVSLNGTTQWFTKSSFSLGGTGFFAMVVCRATASTAGWLAAFSSNLVQLLGISNYTASHYDMTNTGDTPHAIFGSANVNQTVVAWGYTDHAIGAGNRMQVGVSTTTPVSTSGTSSATQSATTGTLAIGGTGAGYPGEVFAAYICNGLPSTTQIQLMLNYTTATYGKP